MDVDGFVSGNDPLCNLSFLTVASRFKNCREFSFVRVLVRMSE